MTQQTASKKTDKGLPLGQAWAADYPAGQQIVQTLAHLFT
jgi:hypothetical protein